MPAVRKPSAKKQNREAAITFLELAAGGSVREAFDRYVAPDFRHHNPYFRGDANALAAAMASNAVENPGKVIEVRRSLADGNLVAVHARVRLRPDSADVAVIHIFRFKDGRIVEMWEASQAMPGQSVNELGMF